ncbi:MAG: hypothetical protein HC778_00800 [Chamaesiphon sp. CSU_1_12]|nr:hypothetical protein [Chamaesiphon sp. CSU_1_12]
MSAIDHINILFAIAVQLMAKADDDNIEIEQSKKDGFFNWFKERTQVEESKTTGSGETGFDLFGLIKLKMKTDNTIRDELKTKFTKKSSRPNRHFKLNCDRNSIGLWQGNCSNY